MVHILRTARIWSLFYHAGAYERGRTESAKGLNDHDCEIRCCLNVIPKSFEFISVEVTEHRLSWLCKTRLMRCASILYGDRVITCSLFVWQDEHNQCKIWGEILMLILGANNLVYCVALLISLSFLFPLAQAVPSSWATQTVLACPIVWAARFSGSQWCWWSNILEKVIFSANSFFFFPLIAHHKWAAMWQSSLLTTEII